MRYKVISDKGMKRTGNEDFLFASDNRTGRLPNLFVVADGMGGHNAGEVASMLCVETIVEHIRTDVSSDCELIFKNAISKANSVILSRAQSEEGKEGMGTTVVLCSIIDDKLHVASVGDSRLYIHSKKELRQITFDHTVVSEMFRVGSISKIEAKRHPKRHMLTKAVGVTETVDSDYICMPLKGNEDILLATDGLTNMIEDEDINAILNSRDSIDTKVSKLLTTANSNGGDDNITFILIEQKE